MSQELFHQTQIQLFDIDRVELFIKRDYNFKKGCKPQSLAPPPPKKGKKEKKKTKEEKKAMYVSWVRVTGLNE